MAGYIGKGQAVVSNGAERKWSYTATAAQTTFNADYTNGKVHVYRNGVRLVDGTDYTATNGSTVVLGTGATLGDSIVIVSFPSFSVTDTVSAANGGTFVGAVNFSDDVDVAGAFTSVGIDDNAAATAMTIDSSGNVGIGTSSPTTTLDVTTTIRSNANAATNDATVGKYSFYNTNASASSNPERAYIEAGRENSAWGAYLKFATSTGTGATTERMRIDSSGNLLVGGTSQLQYSKQLLNFDGGIHNALVINDTTSNSVRAYAYFSIGGSLKGSITGTTTAVAYNTTSDYRLKTDVQPMTGATERLKALKPVNFEWIADGTRVDGFLAHEAQEVVPEAVTGTKDAVDDEGNPEYQGIDQSKLVPLLVATIQELEARIAALESN